jgi:hypothetical protein
MKGQQIAVNRTAHSVVELHEDSSGEYYAVVTPQEGLKLIRGEYLPLGNRLQFPNKWGKGEAALYLINHKIVEQEAIIARAAEELSKLQKCLTRTEGTEY